MCKSYIEVKVSNVNKLTALLEEKLGYSDYKVLPGDMLQLFDKNRDPQKISELII